MLNLEGMSYRRVYYVVGVRKTHEHSKLYYEIKNPPNAGFGRALVVEPLVPKKPPKKPVPQKMLVFCPFTLTGSYVSPEAGELHGAEDQGLDQEKAERLVKIMTDHWRQYCSLGLPKDYELAAMLLNRMGAPVPTEVPVSTGEQTENGKDPLEKLLKPLNKETKRGAIAEFFMEQESRSILECMAQFGSSRAVILTHLYGLHMDHGLGYKIVGDTVTITLPEGCEDPFSKDAVDKDSIKSFKEKAASSRKAIKDDKEEGVKAIRRASGKPLKDQVTELPEKGKRREVALLCAKEWITLEKAAAEIGCSAGSIRSHLVDLHNKHGFGYEQDGNKVRLLVPEGWAAEGPKKTKKKESKQ